MESFFGEVCARGLHNCFLRRLGNGFTPPQILPDPGRVVPHLTARRALLVLFRFGRNGNAFFDAKGLLSRVSAKSFLECFFGVFVVFWGCF